MGDVISLNRFRKAKERAEAARKAEENRVRHGRTRAEKEGARHEQERQDAALDGKRLEPEDEDGAPEE